MKTSPKRRIFLAAAALLALVLVVIAGAAAWRYARASRYQKQIRTATRYWQQEDYVNARVAFSAALKIDETKEDAYVGLVRVYHALGDDEKARLILEQGLRLTPGRELYPLKSTLLDNYFHVEPAAEKQPMDDPAAELNTSLLNLLAGNSYDNYRARYGIESCQADNASCQVRVTNLAATLYFTPTEQQQVVVKDGKPIAELRPTWVMLDDVSLLFGGSRTVTMDELKALRVSGLTVEQDAEHGYVVCFTARDCEIRIACDAAGTVSAGAWNSIRPQSAEQENADGMALSGRVINAATGGGVNAAKLSFVSRNGSAGEMTIETDSYGRYEAALPAGDYRVTIRCTGFTEETFDCTVSSYLRQSEQNFTITPTLGEGQIRIVLTWGSTPRDLDSYLDGTTDSGVRVYTSFRSRTCVSNGQKLAELDVDDTDGYGPETTTLYDINGTYEFRVVDFTGSGTMSSSGAVVKVYTPDSSSPVEIPICGGLENGWLVCRIDHGAVTVLNTSSSTVRGNGK